MCWANSNSYEESDIVIVGIPDQSHSHSIRKGTALAPNAVRVASNKRDVYVENKIRSIAHTNSGRSNAKIFDYGNIPRKDITETFAKFAKDSKIPITIGGDHSLTTPLIKAFTENTKPISRSILMLIQTFLVQREISMVLFYTTFCHTLIKNPVFWWVLEVQNKKR